MDTELAPEVEFGLHKYMLERAWREGASRTVGANVNWCSRHREEQARLLKNPEAEPPREMAGGKHGLRRTHEPQGSLQHCPSSQDVGAAERPSAEAGWRGCTAHTQWSVTQP